MQDRRAGTGLFSISREIRGLNEDGMIKSPGRLLYRMRNNGLEVLLAHPGGPCDCDAAAITSNTFTMEWPLRSGRKQFPEVDRAVGSPRTRP